MYMYAKKKDQKSKVIQRKFIPYGESDEGRVNYDEKIVQIDCVRENHMRDYIAGDDMGSIKHYVPYNWIMKNIVTQTENTTKGEAADYLASVCADMNLGAPGLNGETSRIQYDREVENMAHEICDWKGNLYRHSRSSGDDGGDQIDTPHGNNNPLNTLRQNKRILDRYSLGGNPR